jgi:ElaB/YqjD/DUF883 family membrane-anchored ribosome-binding protein
MTKTSDTSSAVALTEEQAESHASGPIDKASDAARLAADHLAAGAHRAASTVTSVATQAAEALEASGRRLRKAQSRLTKNSRNRVRHKPLTALGIALAAGFLVGSLLMASALLAGKKAERPR